MTRLRSAMAGLLLSGSTYAAIPQTPVCAEFPTETDATTPVAELRSRVETLFEVDPTTVVGLICATIPRVAREYGEDSAEIAWWIGSLATPLIAYMDRHDEAIPLLEFALPLYQRHLGPHSAEVADVYVARAWINFRRGLLEESSVAWQQALAVREHNPGANQIELQKALVGLAHARLAQRRFDDARAALDRANAILEVNGDAVSEAAASIANAYTNIALREENYPLARVHSERQIAIERQLVRTSAQLVSANVVYAQILEHLDEYEAAEQALRDAIALAEADEAAPLQRHHLAALTQLAATLNERGKPREAAGIADRAVLVGEATLGAGVPRLLRVFDIRAEVHRAVGALPAALRDYERADAIVAAHPADVEKQSLVAHYRGKGALFETLGDVSAARAALRSALTAAGDDTTLTTERAQSLIALARLPGQSNERRRERLSTAKALLEQKLPESHPELLRVVNDLCATEIEAPYAPYCDDAAARLSRAREVEPALASLVLGNQSRRAQARRDPDAAYAHAVDSLATAVSLGTPDPQWRALIRLAELLQGRGDPRLAIFFGKQAIAEIERLRSSFVEDDRRFERGFLADKTGVYRSVADWLFGSGRIDEGLEVLSLLKTEELHDFIRRDASADSRSRTLSYTPFEQELTASYRAVRTGDALAGQEIDRLSRLREADRISVSEGQHLETLLSHQARQTRRRAQSLRAWLADAALAPFTKTRIVRPQSKRVERIRHRFGEDAAFAAYLLTDTHLRVIIATRRGVEEHTVPISAANLRADIGRLLDDISARREVKGRAHEVYRVLFAAVDEAATAAGARRVVLWPDGAIRYVPFAALHDGERFVSEKFPVQIYAESATDAAIARGERAAIRGLGVTRAQGEYRPLPAMAEELCSIIDGPIRGLETDAAACADGGRGRGVVRGEGFVDAMFTEDRLRSMLGDGERGFELLHLGTHFELRPGNALRSTLLLGDGSHLNLDEIARFDFRGLELVTLSACQTGVSGAVRDDGREVEGLSAVVQRRGARRVVASLWAVEDVSTARLMQHLYQSLAATRGDASLALNEARSAIRAVAEYSHPYYWAGFFVSGDVP